MDYEICYSCVTMPYNVDHYTCRPSTLAILRYVQLGYYMVLQFYPYPGPVRFHIIKIQEATQPIR